MKNLIAIHIPINKHTTFIHNGNTLMVVQIKLLNLTCINFTSLLLNISFNKLFYSILCRHDLSSKNYIHY